MGKRSQRVTNMVVARLVRITEVAMVVSIGDNSKVEKGGELVTVKKVGRVVRVGVARVAGKDSEIVQSCEGGERTNVARVANVAREARKAIVT